MDGMQCSKERLDVCQNKECLKLKSKCKSSQNRGIMKRYYYKTLKQRVQSKYRQHKLISQIFFDILTRLLQINQIEGYSFFKEKIEPSATITEEIECAPINHLVQSPHSPLSPSSQFSGSNSSFSSYKSQLSLESFKSSSSSSQKNKHYLIKIYYEGKHFGNEGVVSEMRRNSTCVGLDEGTLVLKLSIQDYLKLMKQENEILLSKTILQPSKNCTLSLLSVQALKEILVKSFHVNFKSRQTVVSINKKPQSVFIILSGAFVVLAKTQLNGNKEPPVDKPYLLSSPKFQRKTTAQVSKLGEGEMFGESEIINNQTYQYCLRCEFEGEVLVIPRVVYEQKIVQNKCLLEIVKEMVEKINELRKNQLSQFNKQLKRYRHFMHEAHDTDEESKGVNKIDCNQKKRKKKKKNESTLRAKSEEGRYKAHKICQVVNEISLRKQNSQSKKFVDSGQNSIVPDDLPTTMCSPKINFSINTMPKTNQSQQCNTSNSYEIPPSYPPSNQNNQIYNYSDQNKYYHQINKDQNNNLILQTDLPFITKDFSFSNSKSQQTQNLSPKESTSGQSKPPIFIKTKQNKKYDNTNNSICNDNKSIIFYQPNKEKEVPKQSNIHQINNESIPMEEIKHFIMKEQDQLEKDYLLKLQSKNQWESNTVTNSSFRYLGIGTSTISREIYDKIQVQLSRRVAKSDWDRRNDDKFTKEAIQNKLSIKQRKYLLKQMKLQDKTQFSLQIDKTIQRKLEGFDQKINYIPDVAKKRLQDQSFFLPERDQTIPSQQQQQSQQWQQTQQSFLNNFPVSDELNQNNASLSNVEPAIQSVLQRLKYSPKNYLRQVSAIRTTAASYSKQIDFSLEGGSKGRISELKEDLISMYQKHQNRQFSTKTTISNYSKKVPLTPKTRSITPNQYKPPLITRNQNNNISNSNNKNESSPARKNKNQLSSNETTQYPHQQSYQEREQFTIESDKRNKETLSLLPENQQLGKLEKIFFEKGGIIRRSTTSSSAQRNNSCRQRQRTQILTIMTQDDLIDATPTTPISIMNESSNYIYNSLEPKMNQNKFKEQSSFQRQEYLGENVERSKTTTKNRYQLSDIIDNSPKFKGIIYNYTNQKSINFCNSSSNNNNNNMSNINNNNLQNKNYQKHRLNKINIETDQLFDIDNKKNPQEEYLQPQAQQQQPQTQHQQQQQQKPFQSQQKKKYKLFATNQVSNNCISFSNLNIHKK